MIRKSLVVLLMLAMPVAHAQDEPARNEIQQNPLIGTWNLVRYADNDRLVISEKYISEGVPVTAERVLVRSHGIRK